MLQKLLRHLPLMHKENGKFNMGIITEAVICNLKRALEDTKTTLNTLKDIESCCRVGFRNPYDKKHQEFIDSAKLALQELHSNIDELLKEEIKYE